MPEDVFAKLVRKLLAQAHGHPAAPDAQRLSDELHAHPGEHQPAQHRVTFTNRKRVADRFQHHVRKRLGQVGRYEAQTHPHQHHGPNQHDLALMRLEVGQDAADRLALAHACGADLGAFRKQQLAGWTALLVFLVRLEARMFPGRLDRLAGSVLVATPGLLENFLVAVEVVDVFRDAPELALLRIRVAQDFHALAVHRREQRAATHEPVDGRGLDLVQRKVHARDKAVAVRRVHAQTRRRQHEPLFAEVPGRIEVRRDRRHQIFRRNREFCFK